ncbi:hypothetical protein H696_01941 [Fonticula alba]|uniref:Uncharacterized protein n=1 Tax=Fonticula alba TaxID=691883 RepID=A0A058Z9U7_FONAL|nr:hypothetical protein H696_01941 [Fonticula alba]KCV70995.1 hypothetical protein H696_01941 [Fonticula alba]|eukprot:XP_009494118.1 hypothetical protein H696_01941 [Fonticula alba]
MTEASSPVAAEGGPSASQIKREQRQAITDRVLDAVRAFQAEGGQAAAEGADGNNPESPSDSSPPPTGANAIPSPSELAPRLGLKVNQVHRVLMDNFSHYRRAHAKSLLKAERLGNRVLPDSTHLALQDIANKTRLTKAQVRAVLRDFVPHYEQPEVTRRRRVLELARESQAAGTAEIEAILSGEGPRHFLCNGEIIALSPAVMDYSDIAWRTGMTPGTVRKIVLAEMPTFRPRTDLIPELIVALAQRPDPIHGLTPRTSDIARRVRMAPPSVLAILRKHLPEYTPPSHREVNAALVQRGHNPTTTAPKRRRAATTTNARSPARATAAAARVKKQRTEAGEVATLHHDAFPVGEDEEEDETMDDPTIPVADPDEDDDEDDEDDE